MASEPRVALVLATGQVAAREIASVPACPPSARAFGRQLAGLGFAVVESVDRTRGETAAAIADFARQLRDAPGAKVVIYVCGPIAELEGRAFALPASAVLDRPTDALTQGVLLRSLLDMPVQARAAAALFALDAFAETPRLPSLPAPSGEAAPGLVVSSQAGRDGQRTALAAALLGELTEPAASGVDLATLLTRLQARLEAERPLHRVEPPGSAVALLQAPPPAAPTPARAADPTPVAPPAPATPAPTPEPEPASRAAPAINAAPGAPAAAAPAPPAVTDEIQLSEADRRLIQTSLSRLGYYRDRIDGNFRPSARAAIRRYQREIGEAATGALTAEQARRLLAGAASRRR